MDLWYILFNTLVYGLIAFVFAWYFARGKFLNLGVGAILIVLWYCIQWFVTDWFSWMLVAVSAGILALTIRVNRFIIHAFPNEKQRDLFGIIFTFGLSVFLENATSYLFWASSVSLSWVSISLGVLVALFVIINLLIWYVFGKSYFGKVMQWVHENDKAIRSLGVPTKQIVQWLFFILFLVLAGVATMILIEGNMRASDALFYMIKWIGIMILVGVSQKQRIIRWALIYVLLEYLMFISLWWPIAYKETLILVIILLVLVFRPEWLFSFTKRKH